MKKAEGRDNNLLKNTQGGASRHHTQQQEKATLRRSHGNQTGRSCGGLDWQVVTQKQEEPMENRQEELQYQSLSTSIEVGTAYDVVGTKCYVFFRGMWVKDASIVEGGRSLHCIPLKFRIS